MHSGIRGWFPPQGKIGKFLFPPKISHPQKPLNKGKYPIFLVPPHSKNCQKFSVPPKIFGGDATMEKLCHCGQGIQNQHHLFECPLMRNITESFSKPCRSPKDFFENPTMDDLKTLHKALTVMSDFQNDTSD